MYVDDSYLLSFFKMSFEQVAHSGDSKSPCCCILKHRVLTNDIGYHSVLTEDVFSYSDVIFFQI